MGADTERARDRARLSLVALRDVSLAAAALSLFAAAEVWLAVGGGALAWGLALFDGLAVGVAIGALAHEWGHFLGARWAGGAAPLRPIGGFLPLFDFDYAGNDPRAFRWMSVGGNVAHWAIVVLFLVAIDRDTIGGLALVSGGIGFAVFSSVIEFPVIRDARRGLPPLEALGRIPKDFVRRTTPWAVGAALASLLLL